MGVVEVDLNRLAGALPADEDVVFAYLFGSRATGEATAASDVDVAVYLRDGADAFETRLRIMGALERILRSDAVDVVVLNTAPLALAGRILRTRRVLVDRDPYVRHAYESLIARQFADFRFREHRLLEAMTAGG